ncbi:MAG: S24/S26 family peptidase [Oscillospiraceae bacterium]|nr:S24/S26 family peptidase [Oscillospiraceae bacterium]
MQTRAIPMEELTELIMLQLENGGKARLTVTGVSMMPMLYNRRDTVNLIPVDGIQKVGEVILYRRENGQYVLHRIIQVTENGYICCGDNQAMREPVEHSQLLAVMESFTRKGKTYKRTDPGYRFYTWIWVNLFLFRKPYIAVRRFFSRIRRRLKNNQKKGK